ncbi:hypothetical protein MMC22_000618 [Lobaria immixta]|nr:hypothetical protein [Lobaria immixta]
MASEHRGGMAGVRAQRDQTLKQVEQQLLQLQDVIDDIIEKYYQYVKKDKAWKVVTTKAAFEADFAAVKQVAKTCKRNPLECLL